MNVKQTDVAGNVSDAAVVPVPDTLAPEAPIVTVGEDGVTLTITGEPGATATIYDADGEVIDTVELGETGEATYVLEQTNGQDVTVTQTDEAGNISEETPVTLPDSLAPPAPTVTVGEDGITLTITGEPNATATIYNAQGGIIATVPLGAGGSATYELAQSNGQNVLVTQTDEAGNQSEESSATVPDTLPPAAPTELSVSPDGNTISGKGEPETKVVIRDGDNNIVGEGNVGSNGSFQITLNPPQRDGGQLSATLEDAAENVSESASATAPLIDPASTAPIVDNVSAEVNIVPTSTNVTHPNAAYVLLVGLLGTDITVLSVPSSNFVVAQGHQQNLQFSYSQLLGVDVASSTTIVVQKLMPDGTWSSVDGSGDATLLNLTLLGNSAQASALLGEGTYRAFAASQSLLSVGLIGNLQVSGTDLNYVEPSGVQVEDVEGNVLANDGTAISSGHLVTSVTVEGIPHAVAPGTQGTTIEGQYGNLVIHQDGSYTYTPNGSLESIGKVDQFTYTKFDPLTGINTQAELNIRIDSDGQGLVWDNNNFAEDATYDFAATNDTDTAGIIWANVVNNTFVDQTQGLGAALGGNAQTNSNTFTIGNNMIASGTITLSSTLTVGGAGTVALQVKVGNDWVDVSTNKTFNIPLGLLGVVKTIDLGSLNLPAGEYRVHTTLTGVLGAVSIHTDVNVTYTDQFIKQSNSGTTGNLFDNDGSLPVTAKLQVQGSAGFVNVLATGTVVAGTYGDLTIYSNGSYKYQPHANLSYADREASESFTYKIVLPNGHESTAQLTVDLQEMGQISLARFAEDTVHDDSVVAADHENAAATAEHNDDTNTHTDSQTDDNLVAAHTVTDDGNSDADGADHSDSDVVPIGDLGEVADAGSAGEHAAENSLTEGVFLDDGSGDVPLPFGEDQTSDQDSFVSANAMNGSSADVGENADAFDDPLSHLVPDPLTQEDDLHTTHAV
ncbi:VCBS repeat-containing protein [Brucella pseudogrignonensis]|uniref:VCBS repeat-containing protein n=1 Tax=Brucella pseudogrignonensis TaxID=419475 RepID=A0ABU1MB42_9HYPH|nr:VCBS repeat-containing protein [Brucella pseudogrignonensis]